jgi:hypothetical protein
MAFIPITGAAADDRSALSRRQRGAAEAAEGQAFGRSRPASWQQFVNTGAVRFGRSAAPTRSGQILPAEHPQPLRPA